MSWKQVGITAGKTTIEGHQRGFELQFPNKVKRSNSLIVDGQTVDVESWEEDQRDDVVHVTLAGAGIKEKSDDEPNEGADAD